MSEHFSDTLPVHAMLKRRLPRAPSTRFNSRKVSVGGTRLSDLAQLTCKIPDGLILPKAARRPGSALADATLQGPLHDGHALLDHPADGAGQRIRQQVRDPDDPAAPLAIGEDLERRVVM
jgi:hypothetical protein